MFPTMSIGSCGGSVYKVVPAVIGAFGVRYKSPAK
jgi:hypothetical protein